MEPRDIPPLPIPVEFLIRVPLLIDLSNNLFSLLPDASTFLAVEIDSLICPRICSSPTPIDSRPDVSFNRCSYASLFSHTSSVSLNALSSSPVSDAHVFLISSTL